MKGTLAGPACTLCSTRKLSKPGTRCRVRAMAQIITSARAIPRQGWGRVGVRQASSKPATLTVRASGVMRPSQNAPSRAMPSRKRPGIRRRAKQSSTASASTAQIRESGSGSIESPLVFEGTHLNEPPRHDTRVNSVVVALAAGEPSTGTIKKAGAGLRLFARSDDRVGMSRHRRERGP